MGDATDASSVETLLGGESASTVSLPDSIAGASSTFSGITAPLQFVSPGQINPQVPWRVEPGITDIVVTVSGPTSAAFRAHVGPVSPGIFMIPSGSRQAVAINSDGSIAGDYGSIPGVVTHPARAGEIIMILGTGFGPVTPAPAINDGAAPGDQVRTTVTTPAVFINGTARITFSGLSPESAGIAVERIGSSASTRSTSKCLLAQAVQGANGPYRSNSVAYTRPTH